MLKSFLVFSVIILTLGFTPNTYTQSQVEFNNNLTIYAEIVVRNSEGQLVTYLESDRVVIENLEELHNVLDEETRAGTDPIIDVNGKINQLIKRSYLYNFETEIVYSTTSLSYDKDGFISRVIYWDHDGYPVDKDDKMTITWTILRPIQ